MRLFVSFFILLAIVSHAQDAGSTEPAQAKAKSGATTGKLAVPIVETPAPESLPPLRKYAASPATAQGIRPDKDGKFQNLEVLWPVEVPADYCYWRASIQSAGGPVAAITGSGMKEQGKATLSLIFEGSVVGNSGKSAWTLQGLIGCDSSGREPGLSTETKLTLQPSAFAKRAGLEVISPVQIRTSPGSQGIAALYVRTDAADTAVFEFVDLPVGFQPRIEPSRAPGGNSAMATVFVDQTVRPGRYYLPVKVTVGANQGTGEVVVDVVPER